MNLSRRELLLAASAIAGAGVEETQPAYSLQAAGNPASPAINPQYLTGSLDHWPLEELSAAGYKGLELTPESLEAPNVWQKASEKAGLHPISVNAMHSLRPYLTGSLSDAVEWRRRATLDRLLETLARMRDMAIPLLIVAPSRLAEVYQTNHEARTLLVESLRELASAGDTSILLQSAPFRMFTASGDIASIIDEAAHPNIAAALDIGHTLLSGENPASAAHTLGTRLRYVQVNDADNRPGHPGLDRHLPLGEGGARQEDVRAAIGNRSWSVGVVSPHNPIEAARAALHWIA